MKKTVIALSILSAVSYSFAVTAQEDFKQSDWIGAFGEYYYANDDKFDALPQDRIDWGYGVELGRNFTPYWSARIELAKIDLEAYPGQESIDGNRFGIDAMYHPEQGPTYLFGGFKLEMLDQNYEMFNLGLGRHWDVDDKWKLITEIAAVHDFSNSLNDYSLKLGVAYTFGSTASTPSRSSKDSDFDRVVDSIDKCPNTPSGVMVDSFGCALDSDNDGVLNTADKCPNTSASFKVDSFGCALDDDKDGVVNELDMCANTPKSTKVDKRGCEIVLDDDKDGISNKLDKCPDSKASDKVDNTGCAMFAKSTDSLNLRVTFANNSSVIANPSDPDFVRFADFMQKYQDVSAKISGHSSAVGAETYNMWISQQRANAVKTLLVNKYGIDSARLNAVGYGETQLLDTANTAAANAANRRIEIHVETTVKTKITK